MADTSVASPAFPDVVHFDAWVDSVAPRLAPPVANAMLFGEGHMQKVMIVGGPNKREDYHIENGEEIFMQLKGDMVLNIVQCGERVGIPIREGEVFILPPRIPHSPQRMANTVGLVCERERAATELDGLRWYARDGTDKVLYEEFFHCTDLGVQLKPVIERFFAMDCYRTGVPDRTFPPAPLDIDTHTRVTAPFGLDAWIETRKRESPDHHEHVLFGEGAAAEELRNFEYRAVVFTGPVPAWSSYVSACESETFMYQRAGSSVVTMIRDADGQEKTVTLGAGDVLMVPGRKTMRIRAEWGGAVLVITNRVCVYL